MHEDGVRSFTYDSNMKKNTMIPFIDFCSIHLASFIHIFACICISSTGFLIDLNMYIFKSQLDISLSFFFFVPADGIIIWGTSHVNESLVTGESVPISKEVSSLRRK
ncbi:hypothetical protein ACJX0J_038015 [Zea mays]